MCDRTYLCYIAPKFFCFFFCLICDQIDIQKHLYLCIFPPRRTLRNFCQKSSQSIDPKVSRPAQGSCGLFGALTAVWQIGNNSFRALYGRDLVAEF